jgi:hypothetical protein
LLSDDEHDKGRGDGQQDRGNARPEQDANMILEFLDDVIRFINVGHCHVRLRLGVKNDDSQLLDDIIKLFLARLCWLAGGWFLCGFGGVVFHNATTITAGINQWQEIFSEIFFYFYA